MTTDTRGAVTPHWRCSDSHVNDADSVVIPEQFLHLVILMTSRAVFSKLEDHPSGCGKLRYEVGGVVVILKLKNSATPTAKSRKSHSPRRPWAVRLVILWVSTVI